MSDNEELRLKEERNWKLYEASYKQYDMLSKRQWEQDASCDKWTMTVAAGSFGVSFAFIDKIVDIKNAAFIGVLIGGWSCFLAILTLGFIGFTISSLIHSLMAKEEVEALDLKYKGIDPEYKNRSIFFGINSVLGYLQILLFIGGSICLFLFIGKNLL